jgi:hypothetical protein
VVLGSLNAFAGSRIWDQLRGANPECGYTSDLRRGSVNRSSVRVRIQIKRCAKFPD